ncbi:serine hydrolase [Hydrogenophaga sp.]|uniref:serine hydrolase n=1 Tax=Hydrogenophaga sp. TaxID=1904254 RepID=UPI0025BBEE80|nr:serine hydrolase [Hydrogenophaga sp.]
MIFRASRLQKALKVTACAVLGLALSVPLLGQAATANKKVAAKKQVAAKVVTTKKATKAPTSKTAKRDQATTAKASSGSKKGASLRKAESRQQAKKAAQRGQNTRVAKSKQGTAMKTVASKRAVSTSVMKVSAPARLTNGERLGLRSSDDPLDLNSSVALVVDQDTGEVLFSKNESAVLPIASLTKLMTGLVIADANLPMDEMITITQDDVDTYKGSRSRLAVGTTLSRGELMHLSLMSSENRAAHALGRTYPGGMQEFVRLMNDKARELGMKDTRYVEPTGLLSWNQSSARDLALLVSVAYERPILRQLSTSPSHQLDVGQRTLQYNNSNRLIRNADWDIGLQKTGYISEAGRCLVMQAKISGRKLIMVFLDSTGKLSRSQDAERVRRWVEAQSIQALFARPQG